MYTILGLGFAIAFSTLITVVQVFAYSRGMCLPSIMKRLSVGGVSFGDDGRQVHPSSMLHRVQYWPLRAMQGQSRFQLTPDTDYC
jgi:hypothetical protein